CKSEYFHRSPGAIIADTRYSRLDITTHSVLPSRHGTARHPHPRHLILRRRHTLLNGRPRRRIGLPRHDGPGRARPGDHAPGGADLEHFGSVVHGLPLPLRALFQLARVVAVPAWLGAVRRSR